MRDHIYAYKQTYMYIYAILYEIHSRRCRLSHPINKFADMTPTDTFDESGVYPPDPMPIAFVLLIVTVPTPRVCRGG